MNSEEREIVSTLRSGSIKSFRKLFYNYHKKIYNISRNMGMYHEDAEGIVQDVFLNVWENRAKLDENLSINAFLITITKRLVFKKIRRKVYDISHQDYVNDRQEGIVNTTEDIILYEDIKKYAEQGIEQLPPVRKQVFLLSKQQGLSNDEIAEKLNMSKRTVENNLYRATKSIREYMKKEGINIGLSTLLLAVNWQAYML